MFLIIFYNKYSFKYYKGLIYLNIIKNKNKNTIFYKIFY